MRKTSPFIESVEDRDNVNFIMDIIVSDQLYVINVHGGEQDGDISSEMAQYVQQTGAATTTVRRKIARNTEEDNGDSEPEVQAKRTHKQRASIDMDSTVLWVEVLIGKDEVRLRQTLTNLRPNPTQT